ncbi:MAG TPA: S8 family serine peptidase [Kofleriaceae bacterium]|jgi:hypothetical protein
MRLLASLALASCGLAAGCSEDSSRVEPTDVALCSGGTFHCLARMRIDAASHPLVTPFGFGPADLQSAYNVDVSNSVTEKIGVIEAYGYPELESDLGVYRAQYGLPACTVASGCLTILNQSGQTSPLPGPPPEGDDWVGETALDVAMVSSGCPSCKIVVVEADNDFGGGLLTANDIAALAGSTAISNSWGGPEPSNVGQADQFLDHPGVGIYAASGDDGYNDGGNGASYPASSSHAIAVGGTSLQHDGSLRGWTESAWAGAGSACSSVVAKPSWQTSSACSKRMIADISAVSDPGTGVAIYDSEAGGWSSIGGTSAASPLIAAIFAQTGHATESPQYIYENATGFFDVIDGSNGSCSSELCRSGLGWDGPTGNGTPNGAVLSGAKLPTLAISEPADGAFVAPGFAITASCASNDASAITQVSITIDAERLGVYSIPPYSLTAPVALADGHPHTIHVQCITSALAMVSDVVTVTQVPACATSTPCPDTNDVCYEGLCLAGSSDSNGLGATCTSGSDCETGTCTTGGSDSLCTIGCDAGSSGECPAGFACKDEGGASVCWPSTGGGGGCNAGGGAASWLVALGFALVMGRSRYSRRNRAARRCCP